MTEEISYSRKFALKAIESFFEVNLHGSWKGFRIDHCPLDKKGDVIDIVAYVFPTVGTYDMRFVKKVNVPLKMQEERLRSSIKGAADKMMEHCSCFMVDPMAKSLDVVIDEALDAEEYRRLMTLPVADRLLQFFDSKKGKEAVEKVFKDEKEKKEKYEGERQLVWDLFESMSDESLRDFVKKEAERCLTDEFRDEWEKNNDTQIGVTPELNALVSLVREKGEEFPVKWAEDIKFHEEMEGFHCEFKQYRGLVVGSVYGSIGGSDDIYFENSSHIIRIHH